MTDASGPLARARAAVAAAAARLSAAGARSEVLAEYEPERRVLGVRRPPRMRTVGRVWRLGTLLVDEQGGLHAVGRVVRAERPARRSITAESVAEQRGYRAAAVKGGIAPGETVNFAARTIALDGAGGTEASDALIAIRDDRVMVRWNPGDPGALVDLEAYLAERVELLAHPPQGAG